MEQCLTGLRGALEAVEQSDSIAAAHVQALADAADACFRPVQRLAEAYVLLKTEQAALTAEAATLSAAALHSDGEAKKAASRCAELEACLREARAKAAAAAPKPHFIRTARARPAASAAADASDSMPAAPASASSRQPSFIDLSRSNSAASEADRADNEVAAAGATAAAPRAAPHSGSHRLVELRTNAAPAPSRRSARVGGRPVPLFEGGANLSMLTAAAAPAAAACLPDPSLLADSRSRALSALQQRRSVIRSHAEDSVDEEGRERGAAAPGSARITVVTEGEETPLLAPLTALQHRSMLPASGSTLFSTEAARWHPLLSALDAPSPMQAMFGPMWWQMQQMAQMQAQLFAYRPPPPPSAPSLPFSAPRSVHFSLPVSDASSQSAAAAQSAPNPARRGERADRG